MRFRTAAACLPLLVLTACGDEPSGDPTGPRAEGPEWLPQHLGGEASVDFPTLLVTEGDDALVLMLSDDGVLQPHLSRGGGDFEAGRRIDLDEQYPALADAVRLADGTWFALGNAGVREVDGDEQFTYDPLALRSDDGLTWEQVEVTGFGESVEFSDLHVVDGRLVVVGSHRSEGDLGGFEARAWTSGDGRTFTQAPLPGVSEYRDYDDESSVSDVVATGGALLAAGRVGRRAALWRSEDGGRSWEGVDHPVLDRAHAVSGMHADGPTVVATTSASDTQAIRSGDGGRTWEPVDALPVNEEADGWAPLWAGAGRFFTLTGIDDMSWSEPEVCYADIDQCGYERQPDPRVVASADGKTWTTVDTEGLGEIDHIAGTANGTVLVMTGEADGRTVYAWPSGVELPEADEPALPERVELVEVPEGEQPEVGVRYHAPMYVHCGMDWLWFADATWRRTDGGPGVETGAGEGAPDGWPLVEGQQTLYGYATVLADGTLEYSADDGTVIATYERRGGAPGCD